MQLYSELYNCYYNIMHDLLNKNGGFSRPELETTVTASGFQETVLYLLPKITDGEWTFFKKDGELYLSTLDDKPPFVLSLLQKRWLKAILSDVRIQLFFSEEQLTELSRVLCDIEPLFSQNDFYIFDQFTDGDDYTDDTYRSHFQKILSAIKTGQYLNIEFESPRNRRVHHWYLPCKLEYSIKNDCFRVLALGVHGKNPNNYFTINLSRISRLEETGKYAAERPDIDTYITNGYNSEPVTILIKNERNTLERAMLQFANYKKKTAQINNTTYQCEIYYNKGNERELLIEILSFGPTIQVIGNKHFLRLLKKRLANQKNLL